MMNCTQVIKSLMRILSCHSDSTIPIRLNNPIRVMNTPDIPVSNHIHKVNQIVFICCKCLQ